MSDFRSVNNADKTAALGGSVNSASSLETTAALAQGEANNVNIAKAVNDNAVQEHAAAEEAAKKARELGERFTGRPGGDANDEAVRKSLRSTEVKIDQAYPTGAGTAKDLTGKASETAQQTASSAKGALNTASNKASEAYGAATQTASNLVNAASNKGSEAYNAATQTASNIANTTSNKGSEAYNASTQTASNAANTASHKASEAGNAASSTASETGTGLVGAIQSTASAAVNMTGGYLASARDTAAAATNKVLETVGMGGVPAPEGQATTDSGVPAASAPLESGKHTVDTPYPSKTTTGGNIAEVGSTPSAQN